MQNSTDKSMVTRLKYATVLTHEIVGIAKLAMPATLQTPEVPYIQIQFRTATPLLVAYETEEDRDGDFCLLEEHIEEVLY